MSDWQLIDTAPLVGPGDTPPSVLLYGKRLGVYVGRAARYADGYVFAGVAHVAGNIAHIEATHWAELPTPPEQG